MLIKFEDMFCTLSQAQELKELGIKQLSNFYWLVFKGVLGQIVSAEQKGTGQYAYSAFSVAELGIIISNVTYKNKNIIPLPCCVSPREVWYHELFYGLPQQTEAIARAKVLIDLVSLNETTVEEINARFKQ